MRRSKNFSSRQKAHKYGLDYTAEAEAMYRQIASDLGLEIAKEPDAPVELSMIFPKQEKLRSEVWVCLQNLDELWFVVDGYTCSMFPFEDVKEEFERCLRKALTGEYRIRKFVRRRDGKIFRAYLQQSIGDKWVNVSGYRQIIGFFPTLVYDIRDEFLTTDEAESISSI
ncbi:hypothetical protein [Hyphococcus sp.]|uniref:hypothetical protein n=1 Tax=Hyphococcus sp. TaxID=2038636 RepID=UPI0035C72F46